MQVQRLMKQLSSIAIHMDYVRVRQQEGWAQHITVFWANPGSVLIRTQTTICKSEAHLGVVLLQRLCPRRDAGANG